MTALLAVLTEFPIALLISVVLSSLLIVLYGTLASEKWQAYSRFLHWYNRTDVSSLLLFVAGVGALITVFTFTGYLTNEVERTTHHVGIGVYVYLFFAVYLLLFFSKAPFLEKRDIIGLHKQKTKRLTQLISLHLDALRTQYAFEGKTGFKIQQILSNFEQLAVEVAQEKKIRKNKENVYRSLTRLEKLEQSRIQQVGQIEQLQREITAMYDALYHLEATAMEERFENLKKQLSAVKEKLKNDPYAAQIYLNQLQETRKNSQ